MSLRVFILAGEASGDRLGAALMAGLKDQAGQDIEFRGIAGPLMQAEGMQSQFPMDELSVMGIAEILPKYFHLKRRIKETAKAILAWRPDVVITVDSPDFSHRVAKLVKSQSDIHITHYVAPTVWAWRPGRAARLRGVVDQVLALFPFEPRYFEKHGVRCDFVGHPVVTETVPLPDETAAMRDPFAATLVLLPGSRAGEIARLLPVFLETLRQLPQIKRILLPTLPNRRDQIESLIKGFPVPMDVICGDGTNPMRDAHQRQIAMAAADIALAASGTVSLELAAVGTPMVIAYDMNWLSRVIMQRLLRTDTVTLVNLVSDTRVVPEYIGQDCRPDKIAPAIAQVLNDPAKQSDAMALTMHRLGAGEAAPGMRAAAAVLNAIS